MGKWINYFSKTPESRWLFRGVYKSTFPLQPKAGRGKEGLSPDALRREETAAMHAFRQGARAFLPGDYTLLEWMSIAQHHGVPTRLLDWSESFLVAAWFAAQIAPADYAGNFAHNFNGAIYVSRNDRLLDHDFAGDPFALEHVRVYRPPHISQRIGAQSSVLMLCPSPNKPMDDVAEQLQISNLFRIDLLKGLSTCGINGQVLFADVTGVGAHVAQRFETSSLHGHHQETLMDKMILEHDRNLRRPFVKEFQALNNPPRPKLARASRGMKHAARTRKPKLLK